MFFQPSPRHEDIHSPAVHDADLVLFDEDIQIKKVFVKGKSIDPELI